MNTRRCQLKWLWRVKIFDSSAHAPHQTAPPTIASARAPAARLKPSGSLSS